MDQHDVLRQSIKRLQCHGESTVLIETDLLQRFIQLIAAHTGLQVRAEETDKLRQTILSRLADQQLIDPQAYYQLLASETTAGRCEWEELVLPLTIGESYFFRDSGQFSLLRQRVIPELIERNSAARSLRIWSAGCSTGEEPYSLAILVHELLPTRSHWNVVIVGTDVNKRALAAAQRGIYRQHSLRTLDPGLRNRYFHQHRGDWELAECFRSMVTFHRVNLLKDPFPDPGMDLSDIDLILCRNVFIYFDRTAVARVITKFTDTLRVGGYLVTGHAELHDQKVSGLSVKAFPESIVYRRDHTYGKASQTKASGNQVGGELPTTPRLGVQGILNKPISIPQSRASAPSSVRVSRPVTPRTVHESSQAQSISAEGLCTQAREDADAGRYDAAIRSCQLALTTNALVEKPYYLLAQIAEVQGNIVDAKNFLKKILYVAPASVAAHLELGALYAKEQDLPRARKMLNRALELLQALPPDTVIEPFADLTAGQLVSEVQRRIAQLVCLKLG
jgi:chemotaxis protein methyltransferase CheR